MAGTARYWEHIDVFSHNCKITGSIQKICNVNVSGDTTLADYSTGTFKSLNDSSGATVDINAAPNMASQTGTDDISINAGVCFDGPFIAVHVNAEPCLIYHNGIANTQAS